MRKKFTYLILALSLFWTLPAKADECYNLEHKEPSALTGTLEYVIFPGPPNYENVQTGDVPEPTYILKLQNPICITGDEFADPHKYFQTVQLIATETTNKAFLKFIHQEVTLQLSDAMAASTGHHHEPLVVTVTSLAPMPTKKMDFIDQEGTAATTIQAFYDALGNGQGDYASTMVIPGKRSTSAFSASNLSKFYGSLKEKIKLLSISQINKSTFRVNYHYATQSHSCNGNAVINTLQIGNQNFIENIHALNGC